MQYTALSGTLLYQHAPVVLMHVCRWTVRLLQGLGSVTGYIAGISAPLQSHANLPTVAEPVLGALRNAPLGRCVVVTACPSDQVLEPALPLRAAQALKSLGEKDYQCALMIRAESYLMSNSTDCSKFYPFQTKACKGVMVKLDSKFACFL